MSDIITLETPNYIVRTLTPDDANESWTKWLLDPTALQMLNAKPQTLTVEGLRALIRGYDSKTSYFFGVFDKGSGELIGVRAVYVDLKQKEFVDNLLIGPSNARGKGAGIESTDAAYEYFFEVVGLHRVRGVVVGDNKLTFEGALARGFRHENTTYRASRNSGRIVELRHMRLDRETWRQNQRQRGLARAQAS